TLSGGPFQGLLLASGVRLAVRTPGCTHPGLGSSAFARRYLRNRCFFLFLRLLRCFSSPGSPCMPWIQHTVAGVLPAGFPIQTPAGLLISAPHRSFSQLITSFIGSQCQGIHPALLSS